ncbi:HAD hydrolase-like protein [Bogoriella caseilytica]|uniref:Phosphoglycolate phosphatase n=1 Tax=Bogoriella caseilytica TaxID=56055 RepID=A0A3N2BFQ0_9MICO|nr:HAD hydrolase-like protein [Bogoriella caseilytica]ROR74077.1 phosphoglycolate phosphatase [Bogoriella caseilytica]
MPHSPASTHTRAVADSAALPLPQPTTAVILDLDGTITDSAPAITTSIAEALAACGYRVPDAGTLLRFVGPPIREGFLTFGGVPEPALDGVVAEYRERYRPRMTQVPLYPGVAQLIETWHAAGIPLALATAKLGELARPILADAGLEQFFTSIHGATREDSHDLPGVQVKANVVAAALQGLREAEVDVSGAVMVGDRHHDIEGAAMHGVPGVLAAWGYAQAGEEAGSAAIAEDAAGLARILGLPQAR